MSVQAVTVQAQEKERFVEDYEALARQPAPDWLRLRRKAGMRRFLETRLPDHRTEGWRQTNIAPVLRVPFRSLIGQEPHTLSADDIAPFLFHEPAWTELAFVDGSFARGLSRMPQAPGLAGGLSEAIHNDDLYVRQHMDRRLRESGVFAALNAAFLRDGGYIHIPANTTIEDPIHILHIASGRRHGTAAHPRNLVVAGENSECTVIESYVGLQGAGTYLTNAVTECHLHPSARVRWVKIVNEGEGGYHLSTTHVYQERDSAWTSCVVTAGGSIVRNELTAVLAGENASSVLRGLYMIGGDMLSDNAVAVDHRAPRCASRLAYRGILDGKSHAVFSGTVRVHRGAQKTDSNQLNKNLLLTDTCAVDTKPLLEILADDVKCTHGATSGPPPEEIVFYFRSRGIGQEKARAILTQGFAEETIDTLELRPLTNHLMRIVEDRYSLR